MIIRDMNFNDISGINLLVKEVFDKFMAADYTAEGIKNFYEFISPASLRERLSSGNLFFIAEKDGIPAGIIELRDNSHIALFYVKESLHGKGIGRKLFEHALQSPLFNPRDRMISVNSSAYAEPVYVKFGFVRNVPPMMKDGMAFISMQLKLPK